MFPMHWLFIIIFFGLVQNVHCEEYKCCNKSANGFNCRNSYELLPTSPRTFESYEQASSVCKNYSAYKTLSGVVTELKSISDGASCGLCQKPGSLHSIANEHSICSTCLGNIENFYQPACPICLEEDDEPIEVFQCLHSFHESCRQNSISDCPICRMKISHSIKGLKMSEIISKNSIGNANEFDEEPVPLLVFMRMRKAQARNQERSSFYPANSSLLQVQNQSNNCLNSIELSNFLTS
ncbi:MAG: hypothetical protein AB8G05_21235 [Oligoflexales bacterium]